MQSFSAEKKHIIYSFWIAAIFNLLIVLSFLLEKGLDVSFYFLGVNPREKIGLLGVVTMVFVHADWAHLFNNCISLFVLMASLFYFYRRLADIIFLLCWLFSGLLLWVIGRDSWHIGASGLIYALAFFLIASGFLRRTVPLLVIALLVVLFYGNLVWHVFPWQVHDPVSWEGHLSGAVVGFVLALIYRKQGPQKPVKVWAEEPQTQEEKELAEFAESFELEGDESNLDSK